MPSIPHGALKEGPKCGLRSGAATYGEGNKAMEWPPLEPTVPTTTIAG